MGLTWWGEGRVWVLFKSLGSRSFLKQEPEQTPHDRCRPFSHSKTMVFSIMSGSGCIDVPCRRHYSWARCMQLGWLYSMLSWWCFHVLPFVIMPQTTDCTIDTSDGANASWWRFMALPKEAMWRLPLQGGAPLYVHVKTTSLPQGFDKFNTSERNMEQ